MLEISRITFTLDQVIQTAQFRNNAYILVFQAKQSYRSTKSLYRPIADGPLPVSAPKASSPTAHVRRWTFRSRPSAAKPRRDPTNGVCPPRFSPAVWPGRPDPWPWNAAGFRGRPAKELRKR